MNQVANIEEIKTLAARGAHFFAGHSGGKDSQAMYRALTKIVPPGQLHVIHADLGFVEYEGVKDFIKSNIHHELLIAQAIHKDGSKKDLFSAIRARRLTLDSQGRHDAPAFPSSAARFCTSDLKRDPIWKVIRNSGDYSIVVNCVGIRADESAARAKKVQNNGTLNVNLKNTNSRREAFDYWPIADWSIDQVWTEIADAGQQPHPMYAAGNERLSCVFCILGSTRDLKNGLAKRPELFAAFSELEIEVRTTMFHGQSLADRVGLAA